MAALDQKQPKLIAVLGATGNQGRGVVKALLDAPHHFDVRAITRDPDGAAARNLLALVGHPGRLTLTRGDVYDSKSLAEAFEGSYGVFAMTQSFVAGTMYHKEEDLRHELEAGRNIVDAAEKTGVKHFIFSSLPNIENASNGRYSKVFHFDFKSRIDQWARERLPAVTTLIPGLFYDNLQWPNYCRRDDDGTVRFCAAVPESTVGEWVDVGHDVGIFVRAVLIAGTSKTASKTYPIGSPKISFGELASVFSSMTGIPAHFESVGLEDWTSTVVSVAGEGFKEDIRQMVQWVAHAPKDKICYGTMNPVDDCSWEDLGVKASTFEEWILRSNWRGP
ncbi:NmrA-like family domain-containing protein 1 [Colletotrichum siamense]|uniref:NmrA-like family domain-containing protein 1 n=1 Tax=Colletotrichum siamense TaxID=690259 RepID=A0A9P5BMR3_COLSI|nr:NmrA-like family domain-containing protein 1 [Colletotrichum siamense]KAF4844701.1 NmrA-like family domain-containing protein 1 [Colletotrichum siamense]